MGRHLTAASFEHNTKFRFMTPQLLNHQDRLASIIVEQAWVGITRPAIKIFRDRSFEAEIMEKIKKEEAAAKKID